MPGKIVAETRRSPDSVLQGGHISRAGGVSLAICNHIRNGHCGRRIITVHPVSLIARQRWCTVAGLGRPPRGSSSSGRITDKDRRKHGTTGVVGQFNLAHRPRGTGGFSRMPKKYDGSGINIRRLGYEWRYAIIG